MADSSANYQSTTHTDDFNQWLTATLNGFPVPGTNVATRLIDILDPQDRPREIQDFDAA